jgi:hypothetical protein
MFIGGGRRARCASVCLGWGGVLRIGVSLDTSPVSCVFGAVWSLEIGPFAERQRDTLRADGAGARGSATRPYGVRYRIAFYIVYIGSDSYSYFFVRQKNIRRALRGAPATTAGPRYQYGVYDRTASRWKTLARVVLYPVARTHTVKPKPDTRPTEEPTHSTGPLSLSRRGDPSDGSSTRRTHPRTRERWPMLKIRGTRWGLSF